MSNEKVRNEPIEGFDDIPGAMYHRPGLTTVRQPLRLMGETAARTLLTQLERSDNGDGSSAAPVGPASLLIAPDLVVRGTTAPARR